jgi:phage-related protein (TIGR01555 family)
MAALRAGRNNDGPDGVGQNKNAAEIASTTEQAFMEFLMSGGNPASRDETRTGPFADVIPTPKLDDFKRGAMEYFSAIERRAKDEELIDAAARYAARANGEKAPRMRRNSVANYWSGYGLPGGQGTNLTSFEPMSNNIQFAPLTLQWLTLMYAYTTFGILQRAIDVPVYDAFRGGLDIESDEMDYHDIEDINEAIEEQGVLEAIRDGNIWARLFGGGALIFNSDGEDYRSPLNMDTIGRNGAPIEIYDASRWELGCESRIPVSGYYDFYGLKVHASRVMTISGKRAPFLIRDQLAGWGLSEIQRMSEDFNGYVRTKNAKFELMLEAKVDVFKIHGYKSQLASPMASQLTQRRIALINRFKSFNNAMILDKEDDYEQKQVGFAGIAEMAKENRMDIAESMQMPQSKIWGIGSTGLSSGEDDLETYNSSVESNIREPNKPRVRRVLKMITRATKGGDLSFRFKFKPLRVLSSVDQEVVKKSTTDRILANLNSGLITPRQAIEWQQKEGMIPIRIQIPEGFDQLAKPMNPDAEAAEELRDDGGEGGGVGQSGEGPRPGPGDPQTPKTSAPNPTKDPADRTTANGSPDGPVRSFGAEGREPPPIGIQADNNSTEGADPRRITGAGDSSSAVPWPEPARQLAGADRAPGPASVSGSNHPERMEQARRGGA